MFTTKMTQTEQFWAFDKYLDYELIAHQIDIFWGYKQDHQEVCFPLKEGYLDNKRLIDVFQNYTKIRGWETFSKSCENALKKI